MATQTVSDGLQEYVRTLVKESAQSSKTVLRIEREFGPVEMALLTLLKRCETSCVEPAALASSLHKIRQRASEFRERCASSYQACHETFEAMDRLSTLR